MQDLSFVGTYFHCLKDCFRMLFSAVNNWAKIQLAICISLVILERSLLFFASQLIAKATSQLNKENKVRTKKDNLTKPKKNSCQTNKE